MAATAAAAASFFRPTSSTSTPTAFKPICPNSFRPITIRNKQNPTRLTISNFKAPAPKPAYRVLAVSESTPEPEFDHSNKDATFELKLPRRSLLVQFTCNDCGERTQRLINRLAYERGLVYVQVLVVPLLVRELVFPSLVLVLVSHWQALVRVVLGLVLGIPAMVGWLVVVAILVVVMELRLEDFVEAVVVGLKGL
ncbi:hypothetical protein Ddye_030701 [Dipteronia dyeriana]|uniref:DNL-type domain-containing protein n=1 Tax=Dipteronia dyeriana TaxID=168575 RepID=A0AAD9WLP3_9ROSI|nr:hypothetical protein Ddye_030701 [Dipteronia dyeriana]